MHEAKGGGIKGGGLGSRSGTGKPAGCALRAGSFFYLSTLTLSSRGTRRKEGEIKGVGSGFRFGTGKPAGCALSLSITIDAQTCKRGMDSENAKKPAWSGQESLMKKMCDKLKG